MNVWVKETDEILHVSTSDGETIDTTTNHPFYVEDKGWVAAGDLEVGDVLYTADGDEVGVTDLELEKLADVVINSYKGTKSAPQIVSVSFRGVRAEVLLHALEDKNIYVSSGSACSSNKPGLSNTLVAIGLDNDLLDSTLRFSFCYNTTKEELDYAVSALKELLPVLRKYTRH